MAHESFSPWYSEGRAAWERDVAAWLAEMGRARRLGEVQALTTVKERPWSVVWRVTFEKGVSYFKACSDAGKHEPALHLFLEQHVTLPIPQSQAVHLRRDWILTASAGVALRETVTGEEQMPAFAALLSRYAEMQISCLPFVHHLRSLRLPDQSLSRLPGLLETLLLDPNIGALNENGWRALRAAARRQLPLLEKVCEALGATPYALSLDHGDLHQGNMLVEGEDIRLSDWGDASLTHPFCSIMVTLETVLSGVDENEKPRWARYLCDAYLDPWTVLQSHKRLATELEQALWLARLIRAINCARMFRAAPDEILNRWRPLIFEQLQMWVEHAL